MAAATRNGKWIDADGSQIAGTDGWIGWEQRASEVPVAVLEDTNARFDISQVRRVRRWVQTFMNRCMMRKLFGLVQCFLNLEGHAF